MVAKVERAKRPVRTSVWLERTSRSRGRRQELPDKGPAGTTTVRPRRTAPDAPTDSATSGSTPPSPTTDTPPTTSGAGADPGGLDRDRITEVSVRLLDAGGFERFSMRRLAAELGVTAMSLYWYVDTKDDLLELSLDHVFGEARVPDSADGDGDGDGTDWRDRLRVLAASYRTVFVRHPWASRLIGKYLNIGPCATVFSQAVQAVVRDTGLTPRVQMGAISAVFQFVYGFGTIEGHYMQRCVDAGLSQDAYYRLAMGTMNEHRSRAGAFASSGELIEACGGDRVHEMRERDFEIALDLLVAGIEALTVRMNTAGSAPGARDRVAPDPE